ncbi:hypothetical protein ABZ747_20950 [Kitasatospora cineracea]|uniref:hypothetical protein n=1 Tax=Kitasatospora cineracea TaxID=88074 RepID=UPI0033D64339
MRDGLRDALGSAGLRLPSLTVERSVTGAHLVQLGGVAPEVGSELATLVWAGAPYVRAVRGGEIAGAVRAYGRGALVLVPADGGAPWSVGRGAVRPPTRADLGTAS